MYMVVSPAKSLDFDSDYPEVAHTQPNFLAHSEELIDQLKQHEPEYFQSLMKISPKLAELNWQRFNDWQTPFTEQNAKAAIFAFTGDVYQGFDVQSLPQKHLSKVQEKLHILSGLYGVLRPFDLIQPYRLEMGTAYKNRRGTNLYQFWQQDITQHLNNILQGEPLINLASNEYFKAVAKSKLNSDIITPVFKDQKNGQFKIISFFAKKARGLMARYIIEHDITLPHELQQFDVAGYYFCAQESNANTYVFKRDEK